MFKIKINGRHKMVHHEIGGGGVIDNDGTCCIAISITGENIELKSIVSCSTFHDVINTDLILSNVSKSYTDRAVLVKSNGSRFP